MTLLRRLFVLLGAVLLIAAIGYFTRTIWGPALARHLDVGTQPERVDYALILAGDPQTRPLAAAILYRHGYIGKVLLTKPPRHGDSPTAAEEFTELAQRILLHEGVKPEDIRILEGDVLTTIDEARVVASLIRSEPQAKFAVVTNDYHTRRGVWSVRRIVPEAAERIVAFSAPTEGVAAENWLHSQVGISTICGEYGRLAFYYLRYGEGAFVAAMVLVGIGSLWMLGRVWRRRSGATAGSSGSV